MTPVRGYSEMKDSGIEWVGEIPKHWQIKVLFQLATQVKNKNKDLVEKNLLSLSYGKIKRKNIEKSEGLLPASFDGYNIIEENDIVLRLTDLQNDHTSLRVGRTTERGIITSAYVTIRPINSNASKYLYYLLHSFDIKKGFYGMGAGVRQGLNFEEVKMLKIPVPPIEEQISIAAYLDEKCSKIDEIIESAKASIEDYKQWKASIIYEAVTKGLDPDVEMRDSGIEWIGKIPKGWRTEKIKRIALLKTTKSPSNEGYIGMENIESWSGKFIDTPDENFMAEGVSIAIAPNDIIFGKLRPYLAKCYLVDRVGCCSSEFIVLKPNGINNRLFKYNLLSPKFIDVVNMSTYGAKMPRTNWDFIGNLFIAIPNKAEQLAIVKYLEKKCSQIDEIIKEKESLILDLESYKKTLIYEFVTGKRKVRG